MPTRLSRTPASSSRRALSVRAAFSPFFGESCFGPPPIEFAQGIGGFFAAAGEAVGGVLDCLLELDTACFELRNFLSEAGMTLVDFLCLCAAALFLGGQGVEFTFDSSELLDQRLLDGGSARAFLLGGDDFAVEGGQLIGLVLEPSGDLLVASG